MSKSGLIGNAVILPAVILVSGFLLGGVYQLTKRPTELATIATNNKAYKAVPIKAETPDSDEAFTAAIPACNEALAGMNFGGAEVENVLKTMDTGGSQLGYVIISLSNNSCGSVVKLSVGLEDDGTITDIRFLGISDIPGLGSKAKEPAFEGQYAGKNAPEPSVTKSGSVDDTQINAINGVAITSGATINAVNVALHYLHNCIQ